MRNGLPKAIEVLLGELDRNQAGEHNLSATLEEESDDSDPEVPYLCKLDYMLVRDSIIEYDLAYSLVAYPLQHEHALKQEDHPEKHDED